MRIAMMSAWNTDSGVAIHAESIGKSWIKMGYDLTVFTFIKNDFHGTGLTGEDESYVIRCFGTPKNTNFLNPQPILSSNFDIFVVQDLRMIPVDKLAKIYPLIKRSAKTIHIVHENHLSEEAWFYQFDWDKVVYFIENQNFIKLTYPNAQFIPFPCFGIRKQDKIETRKKLGLPLDKKIIYSFGQRNYKSFLQSLPPEIKDEAVILYVVSKDCQLLCNSSQAIIRRENSLSSQKFADYLFASDVAIFHKFQNNNQAVLSSTAYQALGCGCPILVPQHSDFFRSLQNETISYEDIEDLNKKLIELFRNKDTYKNVEDASKKFALANSPEEIAKKYIELFKILLVR